MVNEQGKGTDDSSIKPVSSLRSKFENLGHERKPSQTPALAKSPLPQQVRDAPSGGPVRMSLDLPRPPFHASNGLGISNGSIAEPRQTPTRQQRPLSIGQLPNRQLSPPRVTVNSPRSPPKGQSGQPSSHSPTRPAFAPQQPPRPIQSVSPKSNVHAFQPPLPARGSVVGASASSESLHAPLLSPTIQRSPKFGASGPPPVNRAGKPNIPSSSGSTPHAEPLALDLKSDKAISPFSTPPSSSESTPHDVGSPTRVEDPRKPRSTAPVFGTRSYFVPLAKSDGPVQRQFEPPPTRAFERTPSLPVDNRHETANNDGAQGKRASSSHGFRQTLSGRNSPSKLHRIPARTSSDDTAGRSESAPAQPKSAHQTNGAVAVTDRLLPEAATGKPAPPAVPAPRRSMETRRSLDIRPSLDRQQRILDTEGASGPRADDYEDLPSTGTTGLSDFPDASQANRRPPRYRQRPWELGVGYDTKLFTACGEYVCTGGYHTRVWNIKTGESITTLSHGEGIKVTAMAWIPSKNPLEEGQRLWLGTNMGDIHQLDIPSRQIVNTRHGAHARGEVVKIFRHASALWSLDDDGKLLNWKNNSPDSVASLDVTPQAFRVTRGHSASIVVGNCLWMAVGKNIYVYNLTANSDAGFSVLTRPLYHDNTGDITCAAKVSSQPNAVYFGHSDGKVSVYNKKDYSLIGVFNVSVYKISAMSGVGNLLWAGYSTGMTFVYDTSTTPWMVKKDWRAHSEPICGIVADQSSIWKLDRFNVVTLGMDNILRIWDGMLEQDWLEDRMQKRDEEFCDFQEVTASVLTWNAGASKPTALRANQKDDNFFREYLNSQAPPDILIFGFQELVDLEDKKVTAKSFFKSKKKDSSDHEKMSHQYRAWRDHLIRCLDEFMPASSTYTLLQTANLVGLFSCVFIKTSLRPRVKQFNGTEIKRGMGGLHGNKGAIILRMVLDDTSICLINCHLAAGQTQTMHRNNDVAAVMESENLPPSVASSDTFVGGGDGSMILDHEICILNGDLNYRIDAMTRDAVVRAVEKNDLSRLLERDQLLLSRKRNPAFRLRLFQEMPISFAPTYKYDVGTTRYDTSDKKRSPAWCDRVLFRGLGRIKCTEYRRWEVHTSDHRPVSAHFKMRIKSIDPTKQQMVRQKTETELDQFRRKVKYDVMLDYFMNVLGLSQKEAAGYLRT
ncbi:Endonuclease/Exonuclease/phosphatase-like protein 1 [Elsinoe fawcettii]|nr:Endonuclease/Exonuclease/phosphatase-like protein 1 [Elsinoe fawcettii]